MVLFLRLVIFALKVIIALRVLVLQFLVPSEHMVPREVGRMHHLALLASLVGVMSHCSIMLSRQKFIAFILTISSHRLLLS